MHPPPPSSPLGSNGGGGRACRPTLTDCSPALAVRAIRKKLAVKAHPAVLIKTLTVLEACMKNCGRPMHARVAEKGGWRRRTVPH